VTKYSVQHSGQWFLDTVREVYFFNKVDLNVDSRAEGMRRNGTYVQWFRDGKLSEWFLMRDVDTGRSTVKHAKNRGIWKKRVAQVLQEWLQEELEELQELAALEEQEELEQREAEEELEGFQDQDSSEETVREGSGSDSEYDDRQRNGAEDCNWEEQEAS
jgi:hypothetical protein